MEWAGLIGIALWALIPGFIAKSKERNFWGYYFLSFLISPLITMIITLCLSRKTSAGAEHLEYHPNREIECVSCGYTNKQNFDACPKCGAKGKRYVYLKKSNVEVDKICFCRKCGEKLLDNSRFCGKCGTEIVKE